MRILTRIAKLIGLIYLVIAIVITTFSVPVGATVPVAWEREWPNTDFSKLIIDTKEIFSGGVPKDGIPAISNPVIITAAEELGLDDSEPVMAIQVNQSWRAYPIRYLIWHEIVNDELNSLPIAVTYCPLCNSGVVFDRRVGDKLLTFGVSGLLRHSDMIMYDQETESWWQQAIGQGVVGQYAGVELVVLPALTIGWAKYKMMAGATAEVMAQPNYNRQYGVNPYVGYDTSEQPFLYKGENPPHGINPLARVVRVNNMAWPLERLRQEKSFVENGMEFDWREGLSSPLDSSIIAAGREIGSVQVRAASTGELIAHDVLFAFAFHAFFPDGEWMLGE